MITRFSVSPEVCSSSDKDGSTILHIQRDKIYSIIGVGSVIWAKLAASKNGLSPNAIVNYLSTIFKEVSRPQIERDVKHVLESFQKIGIIRAENPPDHVTHALGDFINRAFVSFARNLTDLLLKLKMRRLAAFLGLFASTIILKLVSFATLYHIVKRWPVKARAARPKTVEEVSEAVATAVTWYPKQALCLQRSAATTCLLRSSGVSAQMIIGCQRLPFLAHAWVEVDGQVINDKKRVQDLYKVLDKC